MNNSIYLTFDWDKISNDEKWALNFSIVKANILEQIYIPQGWDVVIGKVGNQLSLTLIDKKTIYYTLFGDYDENENKVNIFKIEYIFLPNEFSYKSVKLIFIASPSNRLMMEISTLLDYHQPPVTYQFVSKQHASLLKNKLQGHLHPLKINKIKNQESNRFKLEVSAIPYHIITNGYDKYILFRLGQDDSVSVRSFLEQSIEIGLLESWDGKKNEMIFTYTNRGLIPSNKELTRNRYCLVSHTFYRNLTKSLFSESSLFVQSKKGRAEFRYVVKQALKDLLGSYNVKPSWRSHYQYFYYAAESTKKNLLQQVLESLIESKYPVTAILQPETKEFLKSKGFLANAFDVEKLKEKIQTYEEIKKRFEKNRPVLQKKIDKIESLKLEIQDLQQEIKLLEEEKLEKYVTVDNEKEKLHRIRLQKEALEVQLDELNDTKVYLNAAAEERQHQLDSEVLKEKSLKKSLEKVYVQLNEFKKAESIYLEVFKNKSKADTSIKSLQKLEVKLSQYKQLQQNIEQAITTVTIFLQSAIEEQLSKLNILMQMDLTYKVSNNVEDIKALLQQFTVQRSSFEVEINYIKQLDTYYNMIIDRFSSAKIRWTPITIQPYPFIKRDVDITFRHLIELFDNQPKGILNNLFRIGQKEWLHQVSDYFRKFMAGYNYWQNVANQAKVQKEKINKQMQVKIYQYCMQIKKGLYDKKHKAVNHFMRETEIEMAEIYSELFKLNREREEKRGSLKYYDESLDEQTFNERKSSLKSEMTELISIIRSLSSTIQLIHVELDDYHGKFKMLKEEVSMQADQLDFVKKQYLIVEKRYEKLYEQYKSAQVDASKRINKVETMYKQLEQLELDKLQLSDDKQKYKKVMYLPILQKVYDKRNEIKQSQNWLTVYTPNNIGKVSGITIIENIQDLSLISIKQIVQQADYIIAFCPVNYDYFTAPALQMIQNGLKLPVVVDRVELEDECAAQLLKQSYSTKFEVKKNLHYISTNHIRNDQYITWITVESSITSTFELLLKELHDSRKVLIDERIIVSKLRLKLFSDDMKVMEEWQELRRSYSRRYHHVKLLKQHEADEDVNIVHFSDSNDVQCHKQLVHLNTLLLQRKPVLIITSPSYLNQPIMEPIIAILNQYKRIKESGREKQWTTAIKSKI